MALFESYERRIDKINSVLNSYGIASIEEAEKITKDAGLDVYDQVKKIQPICFENAAWAYTVGAAIAIKKGCKKAADAAAAIGEGLQAFCIPGSVADTRKVGLGHGNLGKMLLEEETECFCFLAGHESFAAAEGAIGIAEKANKVRQKPLRVILNGLGKDAAQIISRINGFTYVETEYDPYKNEVKEVFRKSYSEGLRAKVNCYGANSVPEGVAIMWKEGVDVSITGNSTNPTRFQHPVAGTYKKECNEKGKKYFSEADHCHHRRYPVRPVPSGRLLSLCCNPFRIFQYLSEIRHPADDPCLCDHGYCGSFTGCREASPDHSGSGLWLHSDRRFRILSGIIQPVPALYE